jgi:TRAP-type C4-dicarboxylate transport system substrate-binding protein
MRDWRGIRAEIGDRIFYVTADGATRLLAGTFLLPELSPKSGWCGETAIQEGLLHLGMWAPQRLINKAGKGVEPLTIFIPSQYVIVSHKPIHTLADFKGQKIRVPGSPLQIEPLKRFGASPLSMPFGEVLPALQNHTIDGVWAGTTLFTALKFYDIAKTMTYLPSHWAATVPLVNRNFMKSLGPDLERVVREEARKADQHSYVWAAEDIKRSAKIWADNGGKEIHLSPAEQKRFLDESIAATTPILTATPQGKEDYEAFAAAARKYRK